MLESRGSRSTNAGPQTSWRGRGWAAAVALVLLAISSSLLIPSARGGSSGIRFVSSATGTGSQLTIRRPPGIEAGDVLVAGIAKHEQINTAIKAPAGWSLVRDTIGSDDRVAEDLELAVYTRVVGSSEPSSYTWRTADPDANGAILSYSGISSSDPVLASASRSEERRITDINVPSLKVAVPNAVLVLFATIEGDTPNPITPPSGFSERAERAVHPTIEGADRAFPRTGSTGDRVAKAPHKGNSIATLLVLRP